MIKRFLPIFTLIVGLIVFFSLDLQQYLSLNTLQEYRVQLLTWTTNNAFIAIITFIIAYIIVVAFSIPGATILTLASGFLFGPIFGTLYVVIAATLGASVIYIAAKTAFHDIFKEKTGKWAEKMEKGFQENAVSYMLFLRLVPLFPFWLVNIVPAILGVRLSIYFITTLVGIIPGSFVYVLVGNGLAEVFALGQSPDLSIIFQPSILAPIIGLAILSLVPILYKKYKKKRP